MVFTSLALMVRARGPDEFWRKRRIFKLAAHYIGRRRNCYSIAIKMVHRALHYATRGRKLKKLDMGELWETRLTGACEQYGMQFSTLHEGLTRCNILLNRRVLSDLAIWEPRTFESLVRIAQEKARSDGLSGLTRLNELDGVVTRGMIKEKLDK
uniref:Large ribosomal subunit protein bL20m n=1 Tax=Xenopsylla cheopis TaxID=163159 RepID=A0A6M2DFF4_XENCH